jgi:hypothetical protein
MNTSPSPRPDRSLFLVLGIGAGIAIAFSLCVAVVVVLVMSTRLAGGILSGANRPVPLADPYATNEPAPGFPHEGPDEGQGGSDEPSDLSFDSGASLPPEGYAAMAFDPPEGTDWVADSDADDDEYTSSYVSADTGCRLRLWQTSLSDIGAESGDDETDSVTAAAYLRGEEVPDDEFARHTFTGAGSSASVDFVDLLWGEGDSNYLAVRAFSEADIAVSVGVSCDGSSAFDAVKKADSGLKVLTVEQ